MNGKCIETGILQAFLDGETAPETSLKISQHIAMCDACAARLAEAEEETSFVFSALDRELNSLVPTQRLWNRINESIESEKSRASVWQRLLTFVTVQLASPSLAAAAAILLVVGMLAVIWTPDLNSGGSELVNNQQPQTQQNQTHDVDITTSDPTLTSAGNGGSELIPPAKSVPQVVQTNHSPAKLGKMLANANQRAADRPTAQYAVIRSPAAAEFLPGEESYIKTIADLRQSVDTKKDIILTPASLVSYERDMAVVDDSIKKMRQAVRRNPRNQAAKQVLYSAYQDKIDLLNSVAQKEELIASMQ